MLKHVGRLTSVRASTAALCAAATLTGCAANIQPAWRATPPIPQVVGLKLADAEQLLEKAHASWTLCSACAYYTSARSSQQQGNSPYRGRRIVGQSTVAASNRQKPPGTVLLWLKKPARQRQHHANQRASSERS